MMLHRSHFHIYIAHTDTHSIHHLRIVRIHIDRNHRTTLTIYYKNTISSGLLKTHLFKDGKKETARAGGREKARNAYTNYKTWIINEILHRDVEIKNESNKKL